MDAIRFLYQRWIRLVFHAGIIFLLGALVFIYWHSKSPRAVVGVVGLDFPEIRKNAYPSGRRFSLEDFRSPRVVTQALADAAISNERFSAQDLAAHVDVAPVIPEEIANRWKKQEQIGAKKEDYATNEFVISITTLALTNQELLRLFDGMVARYQETVKYEQQAGKLFVSPRDASYETLVGSYDFWDIPELIRGTHRTLSANLQALIAESAQLPDSSHQLSFLQVSKDLDIWATTHFQPMEVLTYQGRLVKDSDLVAQRIQFRLQELGIQIRQKSQEAAEASRLLEIIGRPKTLLPGQLNSKEGLIIDAAALDRLVKSDYVGPVVERISRLQGEAQVMEAEKARLEKQLSLLPKSSDAKPKLLPPGYQRVISTAFQDLNEIIQRYDRVLDDYLTARIIGLVVVKQAPVVSRTGYSPVLVLPGIAFLSIFLSIMLLGIERLFEKASEEESQDTNSKV
jgi:hypothetical protein